MPDIRSFRGMLYNPKKIKDIAQVVAEPYDVINLLQQNAYYHAHPYNIIRLILGKSYYGDNRKNNQYTRARKYFADWQRQDILKRDQNKSIYIYTQSFPHNDKRKTRTGFIVLLKLEDFTKNTILPHENTFSQPVQDRLKLLQSVQANLSPIFALFCDRQGKISALLNQYKRTRRHYIAIKKEGVLHKIWRVSDKRIVAKVQKLLKGRQIFIADGHHRYEAALNYKLQMQRKKHRLAQSDPFGYVMTYLVATDNPGLTILPTHRVVKVKASFRPKGIIANIGKTFKVDKFSTSLELFSYMRKSNLTSCIFGAYFGKGRFYGLKLKNDRIIGRFIGQSRRCTHKDLEIDILHSVIIQDILNLVPIKQDISYTKDAQEAIKLVDTGRDRVAFFLRPTTIRQVKKVARSGGKMPHKSTYFYPKLLTGLVINKLGTKI